MTAPDSVKVTGLHHVYPDGHVALCGEPAWPAPKRH
jgi:hypothetical protein